MNTIGLPFAGWLLHSAVGGGILLLLALPLMQACRQPARRQRLGESALLAALVLCVLNLGPSWIPLPLQLPLSSSPLEGHETIPQREVTPFGREAGRNQDDSAVSEEASTALMLSLLDTDSGDVDAAPSDAAQEIIQSGSQAADSGAGIAWASFSLSRWLALLALAYAAISIFLLGRWLLGHWALGRLLRHAQPAPEAIHQLFETMARGQGRRPRLLVSRRLRVPLSCGILRPCVVLPASFCESNATESLRWLFAHELTHLERGDTWTCLLFGLGQVLYFCLPWYWWLRRQVRLCQEYIADAAAAQQAADPEDYAQFLVRLTQAPAVPLGALGVFGNSSDLFRRVTMLLQSPIRVEKRCPRWWSLITAGSLLALAFVVSGINLHADAAPAPTPTEALATVADSNQPAEKPEQVIASEAARGEGPEPADKKESKKKPAIEKVMRDLDVLLGDLSSVLDADQVKRLQEQLQKMQIELKQALTNPKESGKLHALHQHLRELESSHLLQQADLQSKAEEALGKAAEFDVLKLTETLGEGGSVRLGGGRLGVHVQKPGPVLADQLDLPKGQGLVIEHVVPDSAAAKAGLKAHDLLLEFNGKPVPNEAAKFIQMLDEVKANTPVDAVVLRKGKKETVKGLLLSEAKAKLQRQLFKLAPGQGVAPFTLQQPNIMIGGFGGPGNRGVFTTIFRTKESFTTRHQEGSLVITVTGSVTDGKSKVKQIQIQDGGKSESYESADKVPEQYRDKVKNLIEMSEKNNVKIEVGGNSPVSNSVTITLDKGSAATMAQALGRMVPQVRRNPVSIIVPGRATMRRDGSAKDKAPGNPSAPLTLTAFGNKLVATCNDPQALSLVQDLSRLLTQSETGERDFVVIPLKTARATDAAKILDEAFNGNKPERDRLEGSIRVVADPTTNSLLIRARPIDLLMIRKMVEQSIDKKEVNADLVPKNWKIGPLTVYCNKLVHDEIEKLVEGIEKDTKDAKPIDMDKKSP